MRHFFNSSRRLSTLTSERISEPQQRAVRGALPGAFPVVGKLRYEAPLPDGKGELGGCSRPLLAGHYGNGRTAGYQLRQGLGNH